MHLTRRRYLGPSWYRLFNLDKFSRWFLRSNPDKLHTIPAAAADGSSKVQNLMLSGLQRQVWRPAPATMALTSSMAASSADAAPLDRVPLALAHLLLPVSLPAGYHMHLHGQLVLSATSINGAPCAWTRSVDSAAAATYQDAKSYPPEGILAAIALGRLLRLSTTAVTPHMKAIQGTSDEIKALPHTVYLACYFDHCGRFKDAFQPGESHVSCLTFFLPTAAAAEQLCPLLLAWCSQHRDRLPLLVASSHTEVNHNGSVVTNLLPAQEAGIKWIQAGLIAWSGAAAWRDLDEREGVFQAQCEARSAVVWVHNRHMMVHPATALWSQDIASPEELIEIRNHVAGGSFSSWMRESFRLRLIALILRWTDPRIIGLGRHPTEAVVMQS